MNLWPRIALGICLRNEPKVQPDRFAKTKERCIDAHRPEAEPTGSLLLASALIRQWNQPTRFFRVHKVQKRSTFRTQGTKMFLRTRTMASTPPASFAPR